jgi:CheY-like chemotaxis protein
MRVLVVDDDADNCDVLATILEHSGALVTTAQSAADALSLFERQRPDVLISDIGLPGEDGFALLRKVRSLSAARGGNVPAIAITGYASLDGDQGDHGSGFQAQLTKPVTLDEVLIAISRVVEWPAAWAARRELAG